MPARWSRAVTVPPAGPTEESPAQLGFISPGDFPTSFRMVALYGDPSAAETALIACVNRCVDSLGTACAASRSFQDAVLTDQARAIRDKAIGLLRQQADKVAAAGRGAARDAAAEQATRQCWRLEGQYTASLLRLDSTPFTVERATRPGNADQSCDIRINVRDVPIPEDRARLKLDLDQAVMVTRAVFAEREHDTGWRPWPGHWRRARVEAARQRLADYIDQLVGIAKVGLMNLDPSQGGFARGDLDRYKAEFTIREAGTVKNRYVRRLGWTCLMVALLAMLVYAAIGAGLLSSTLLRTHQNFWLLAAGTAVGTWLSFSLRRVTLTFKDLAVLEEDRLDPFLRVLFMIGLVLVIGLLFWTGAVTFGLGALDATTAMSRKGSGALLIGLLAGIAERAIGTAVSRRANDFAVAVGGGASGAAGQGKG